MPEQKKLYENVEYVSPQDIANIVLWLNQQPEHVNINRIEVMPTAQTFAPLNVARIKNNKENIMSETLLNPYFGEFGGMYVPEILVPVLQQLEKAFVEAKDDPEFQREFQNLLKNYAGRPTALTLAVLTKGTKAKFI